ncbi:hypothetical protein R1sor_014135 [Riccia sorocarpa]|uniref:Reverse transcriptase domain-containing protein n=1 Tax=Riccia sorocarpa TaxID=122646 RepID=A0ABD3HAG4_9MARC
MTKTAIEAARHIQQWGRHDEEESSRAASDRRGEVQSRSRPAIRDILRHCFIQFGMTAIQDFATQLRTNRARTPMPQLVDPEVFRRALETLDISTLFTPPTSVPASLSVPPPDLARHAQPEPEVEPEVDPVVDPVVEPEVEHIMEPTVSVESQHPSTEVHGVEGESIMVVERYVAPHQDDAMMSGSFWLVPTRRGLGPTYLMLIPCEVPAFEMYPRRLRETIQNAGMLRYESPTDPQIFEEHVTSSEDGDFDGLQDEEDAMADLFTEWFPPEPPTAALYRHVVVSLKLGGEAVDSTLGVIQGCPLSPLFFGLNIDGLFWQLTSNLEGVALGSAKVQMLFFSDDVAFVAQEVQMQCLLDGLTEFCNSSGLEVNLAKIRWMRVGGDPETVFSFGSEVVEECSQYRYLGLDFTSNLSWASCCKTRIVIGLRALFLLWGRCNKASLVSWPLRRLLFDVLVQPALLFGAPVWGTSLAKSNWAKIEHVHKKFLQTELGVRPQVPYVFLLAETGRVPLEIEALLLAIQFAQRLKAQPEDRYSHQAWTLS